MDSLRFLTHRAGVSVTETPPDALDRSAETIDPLFAQATVAQASPERPSRHHRRRRSRRRQRRQRLIALAAAVAVVAVVAVVALLLRHQPAKTTRTIGFFPATATTGGSRTWTHKDLDGQVIVVKESGTGDGAFVTTATGSLPKVIIDINAAYKTKGCVGGEAAYQQWNPVTPQAKAIPRYSVFARYAVDKGKALACAWAATIPTS
jgi:hypothetical protein